MKKLGHIVCSALKICIALLSDFPITLSIPEDEKFILEKGGALEKIY